MSIISSLSFVLLFDQDGAAQHAPQPQHVYYVLPGSEASYDDPLEILNRIIAMVVDCVDSGRLPCGTRSVLGSLAPADLDKPLSGWHIDQFFHYYRKGFNPVVSRPNGQWALWGQYYHSADLVINPLIK